MVFRKLPGVSASGMGLRLSQKFVFLLFLSGLVTLCFGALFFLPDSVRLKRIFLSKTEIQPVTVGSGSENDAREHVKRPKEQGMTPGKGETTSIKQKNLSRRPPSSLERTDERLPGGKAQEDLSLPKSRTEPATSSMRSVDMDTFSYNKFRGCLLKPPMGRDNGRPNDPVTNERREKVKESAVLRAASQALLSPVGQTSARRERECQSLSLTHLHTLRPRGREEVGPVDFTQRRSGS
uniref:Mannosyl-oligosaccharide 1,2-alpha-mannosidase IC-like n=1 Tax=Knipowitschia caucasica TaxID=637954 RepID=A0AAV2MA10_KNICA